MIKKDITAEFDREAYWFKVFLWCFSLKLVSLIKNYAFRKEILHGLLTIL